MKKPIILLSLLASMLFGLYACEENTTAENVQEDMEEAGEDIADVFRTEQEELEADLRDAREDLSERIADLQAEMANVAESAQGDFQNQIDQLEQNLDEVDQKMEALGNQVSEGWSAFKSDVRQTLEDIDTELEEKL